MTKKLLCLLFLTTLMYGQERIVLYGSIKGDGAIENIHILNKNSTKGTISDKFGRFQLAVMPTDTLVVSGIQFYYQEIVITEDHITNKTIPIDLLQRINELDEITLKTNPLSGFLQLDLAKAKDSISKVNKGALNFSGLDLGKPYVGPIDANDRARPPDPFGGNNGVPGFAAGGDILGLVGLILGPVFESVGKIGETKRNNKRYNRLREKQLLTVPDQLLEKHLNYIVKDLHIPANQLYPFIAHCKTKGILPLFLDNRQIEVLDILYKESEIFLKNLQKNKD